MAQDYEVLQFKKGDFQDNFGNYWCDMALKGVGEPVRIAVKDPTQFSDGMKLYGVIESKTSKAGKEYLKFKREEREEDPDQQPVPKKEWKSDEEFYGNKNAEIKAQWAIGQAVQLWNGVVTGSDTTSKADEYIEAYAKKFYAMVDRVKGSSESTDPKALNANAQTQENSTQTTLSPTTSTTETSGYDKFKQSRPMTSKQEEQAEDEELISLMESQPVNLDEIPY